MQSQASARCALSQDDKNANLSNNTSKSSNIAIHLYCSNPYHQPCTESYSNSDNSISYKEYHISISSGFPPPPPHRSTSPLLILLTLIHLLALSSLCHLALHNGNISSLFHHLSVLKHLPCPPHPAPCPKTPILQKPTLFPPYDYLLRLGNLMFAHVIDGSASDLGLYAWQFGGQWAGVFACVVGEGVVWGWCGGCGVSFSLECLSQCLILLNPFYSTRDHDGLLLIELITSSVADRCHSSILLGLAFNAFSYGVCMPLWAIANLLYTSSYVNGGHSLKVSLRLKPSAIPLLRASPKAVLFGCRVPATLMCIPHHPMLRQ